MSTMHLWRERASFRDAPERDAALLDARSGELDTGGPPLVSVLIPTYNCARYVAQAVASALAQTYVPIEVIVVDDGSTDGTERALEPYLPRICYLRQENRGCPAARNAGLRQARGTLIALLDADDLWYPHKLEQAVAVLEEHPQSALVHSELTFLNEATGEYAPSRHPRHEFTGSCYQRLFHDHHIIPSTVVLRRECLERVGGFDETLRNGYEDYDLWLRLARHHPFAFLPQPLTIYRQRADSLCGRHVPMVCACIKVVRKALQADPSLRRLVGAAAVRHRLFELCSFVGYASFERGDLSLARRYLGNALWYQPTHRHSWVLWLSTFLPPRWRRFLHWCKHRMVLARQACPSADEVGALRSEMAELP